MAKNKQNYLDLVPIRSSKIDYKNDDNGGNSITLLIKNTGLFYWLAQKLFKKPRITQVHLDEMGSFIWPLIDGNRTISDIADLLDKEFGEKAKPLYERIVKYFEIMKTNEFIEYK